MKNAWTEKYRQGSQMQASISPSTTFKRPLGHIECIHYILNSYVKILRNVVVTVEVEKSISINLIKSFLQSAHNNFIALRLKTREGDNKPIFLSGVPHSSIPIRIININSDEKFGFISVVEHEMNEPINSNNHMWRATVLQMANSNVLILTFHHSIFDGRSIIKLLSHMASAEACQAKVNTSSLYTAIEQNIHLAIPPSSTTSQKKSDKLDVKYLTDKPCEINDQKSKFLIIDLEKIRVDSLRKLCKKNNITINALINAAAIKAISINFPAHNGIAVHTPIDLTKYSNESHYNDELGCFIAIIHSLVKDFKDKNLLEIARLYKEEFSNDLSGFSPKKNYDFIDLKNNLIRNYNKTTSEFSGGICISNIGEIILGTKNEISSIKEIYFSTSVFGGLGILILSALTFNNQLKVTLSYTSPLLNEEFINSFIASFKTTLLAVK